MGSQRPISTLSLPRSTISALTRAGYETTQDLVGSAANDLAKELDVSIIQSQAILTATKRLPATQSAASMMQSSTDTLRCCAPLDKLLGEGLPRGYILEVSGPPGTPKGSVSLSLIRDCIGNNEEVLVIDPQNVISPTTIDKLLCESTRSDYRKRVHLVDITTTEEFLAFFATLPSILETNPKISLLVLNSISFFFQAPLSSESSYAWKKVLLERLKPIFMKACVTHKVSIVLTSQLATKMVDAGGKNTTFDSGSRAVMVPYLGESYLPSSRSYRVIIAPDSRETGTLRLLFSPTNPHGKDYAQEQHYRMINGNMQLP